MLQLKGHFNFFFVFVIALVTCQRFPGEKPGRCPRNDVITTCDCPPGQTQCTRDSDCWQDLKCCSFGCGCRTSCVRPVYGPGSQPGGCMYNGRFVAIGRFPADDGCNTCGCSENGEVWCTYIGCRGVCSLPKLLGTCYAYFPRWWYNSLTNRCEMFIYGGCGGNFNNFRTIDECYRSCGRRDW
ncbi:eppin-like [Saccostrea cucullata]|uniref:eppin-like n=1 Tax=Saccostrea cuccullata TaxID=36930 RepID=UPI002ED18EBA